MARLLEWLRAHLVDDWRNFTRWWSVRMTAIGALLGTALSLMPGMPPEIQAMLPLKYRVLAVGIWAAAAIYARVAKQRDA